MTMKTSRWRNRRGFLGTGVAVTAAVAAAVAGLAAPALARPSAAQAGTSVRGPGYPPPKGIYAPFTNCPLKNPMMHEVMDTNGGGLAACTAGLATGGSIKIGNITTPVVENVDVQFGFFIPPGDVNFFPAPAVPPLAGTPAILSTKPDPLPQTLTQALGCPSSNATVETLCQQAQTRGGNYNKVSALAQQAGQISNFALLSWTQPVKFKLVNPLLGSNCYIGSDEFPVVLNPSLSLGPGGSSFFENDPAPAVHPDTIVFGLTGAVASDSTFSAPGVTGCGPGGAANVAVDDALDASSGLPAASGTNSLTLTGNFSVAVTATSEDSSLPQPQDDASGLLAAFKASTNGEHSVKHKITLSQMKTLLSPRG
jgi:hypothetical protein